MEYAAAAAVRVRLRRRRATIRWSIDLAEPIELMRTLRRRTAWRAQHHLRQPLLQPAHPAAGHLSAQRRLPAAGRSAGGRVPADRRRRGSARRRCPTCRWSAPATRTCRTTCRTSPRPWSRDGWVDFVGLGRMVLSYPELPARRARRRQAAAQARLPHVQRLHHRPAARADLRLLPARRALQATAAARAS